MPVRFIGFPARKPLPSGRGGSAASLLVFADDKTVQHDNTILDLGSKYGVANIAVSHRDTIDCRHIDEFLTVGRDQPQVDCR